MLKKKIYIIFVKLCIAIQTIRNFNLLMYLIVNLLDDEMRLALNEILIFVT